MGKDAPIELTKIKKIAADIHEFPAKIDSAERAKNARQLLKKYAVLSEKIERNVLIRATYQKDLANIRTKEFKAIRRTLKENANLILHAKNNTKSAKSEKLAKKPVKTPPPKKPAKAASVKVTKETDSKKTVKKSSPKPRKASAPKKSV